MRRNLLALLAVVVAVVCLRQVTAISADEKGSSPAPKITQDDVATIIYFAKDRPILFRFYLQIDGQPVQTAWENCLGNLFKFLDRNGDEFLSKEEAARAPSMQNLLSIARGAPIAPEAKIPFADLDEDGDGKVSLEEFIGYYRRIGLTSVTISGLKSQKQMSDAASDALFKILDKNGDGMLTKDEVADAYKILNKYDVNDDELVSPAEILGVQVTVPVDDGQLLPDDQPPADAQDRRFFVFGRDDSPRGMNQRMQLAKELIDRYDKNSDEKLSREEFPIDADAFKALDSRKTGLLSALELVRFPRIPADLEMVVRLGKKDAKEKTLGFYPTVKEAGPLAPFTKAPSDRVMHTVSDADHFDMVVQDVAENASFNAIRAVYLTTMRLADPKQNGYVTKADLAKNPQTFLVSTIFDVADRNADGKLTEKELLAFLDIIADIDAAALSVKVGELGRGLFNMLDVNRDGVLSQYELKHAWEALMPDDPQGKKCFTMANVPQQMQIQVNTGLGSAQFDRFVSFRGGPTRSKRTTPIKAPAWFQKMDLNGDGYVSYREFLGSKEEFEKIDKNHDGLISPEEAEEYEAERQKDQEKK